MAELGKILVCYTRSGRERQELVTDKARLINLIDSPGIEIDTCLQCTELSEEDATTMIENARTDLTDQEESAEKEAARVVYQDLKDKYGFE